MQCYWKHSQNLILKTSDIFTNFPDWSTRTVGEYRYARSTPLQICLFWMYTPIARTQAIPALKQARTVQPWGYVSAGIAPRTHSYFGSTSCAGLSCVATNSEIRQCDGLQCIVLACSSGILHIIVLSSLPPPPSSPWWGYYSTIICSSTST